MEMVVATLRAMSTVQRLRPIAVAGRTHADRHQAIAGPGDRGSHQGQLYEVQRS